LITDQVFMMSNGIPRAAVAANGTIAYLKGAGTGHRELVLVDRSGHARAIGGALGAYRFPRFSPDGKRIAVSLESNAGSITAGDISVLHLEAGSWLRITTDSASYQPEWDPDGKSLVYVHRESRGTSLYKVAADGSGAPVKLLSRPVNIWESRITPDHRMIVWREDNAKTLRDIMAAPLDSVDAVRPIVNSAFDEKGIALSPDGRWLAYVSNETGANQVYIRRLEPNSPHSPVSRRGGTEPRWSKTGELFFRSGDSVFVSRVTPGPVAQITPPAGLFSGPYESTSYEPLWDVSPDGRQFVMVRASANETPQLVLFMNWAEHWTTPRK
jgi:serine/threonine-protein kinase